MTFHIRDAQTEFAAYRATQSYTPLFLWGEAASVLGELPTGSIDFCMTSPPYWQKREYESGGIGLEPTFDQYRENLLDVFGQVQRVLKDTGSFWLNLGDTYQDKGLVGVPWRVALALTDRQGWILRNDVVWNKIKGPDNTKDKLRNTHEYIFHFVKQSRNFYYDIASIRANPGQTRVKDGAIVSATGVTGIRYKRQIELSTALNTDEKAAAFHALEDMLQQMQRGELSDFRMVIRNQQRTTHSDSQIVSGRARELALKGFYFLKYHPDGSKPGDVWEIVPEDTSKRGEHYAAYPEDVCRIPLLATCPPDGIALDPFCGTGTTNFVATQLGRKSVGIDISALYLEQAHQRCQLLL